ncbi:uncharacterized protein [Drosophila virilis]|uniref:ZAD domain-containing protein n=1 Tax=Drosophila virilis TaxID=7244 RepID=B4LZT8_DROVI|nr:uncharacterized protein Dvir_GJ22642 [Drosophila virilis]
MLTVCRLCLAKDANFVIFNGQAAVRIMSCTGLEVDPNDKLPQLICHTCRVRLEEFYYFRKRCHAADRRLRHLIRLDRNFDGQTSDLFDGDKEDALLLKDVAQCSPTACSESNALWRREAAQLIRCEIDSYKSDLLALCKQQVREEIEHQVRSEMEDLLLAQARKECHLSVLDDLFYDIESWFVHKRNNVVRAQALGSDGFTSDMDAAELESISTIAFQNTSNSEAELKIHAESTNLNASEVGIVEVLDDESFDQNQTPEGESSESKQSNKEKVTGPATVVPLTMVEINMQNAQYSHLREDLNSANFLSTKTVASPAKQRPSESKPTTAKALNRNSPYERIREHICLIHGSGTKQRNTYNSKDRNCYRCRLRGSQGKKKSC